MTHYFPTRRSSDLKLPVSVTGSGGRQKRVDPKFGNVYDHFAMVYQYDDGTKAYFSCRQQNDTAPAYAVELVGDEGRCVVRSEEHTSELQSLMHNPYAVFCSKKKNHNNTNHN